MFCRITQETVHVSCGDDSMAGGLGYPGPRLAAASQIRREVPISFGAGVWKVWMPRASETLKQRGQGGTGERKRGEDGSCGVKCVLRQEYSLGTIGPMRDP